MKQNCTVGVSALAIALACASQAQAQTADPADERGLEEIIVTAQRREESLQRAPLAVSAITASDLEAGEISNLDSIAVRVPNLNLGQQLGVAKIALRGVGLENMSAGAEGSVAFNLDGVFVSRSSAALASFYDIEQVEVLRGPQGTLYGRNATGGAINLRSRRPSEELSGYGNLTLGDYGRIVGEGAISGPMLADTLSARLAWRSERRDGFGRNIATGSEIDSLETDAARLSFAFTPTNNFRADLAFDTFRQDDASGAYHYLGEGGYLAPNVQITPFGVSLFAGATSPDIRDISNDVDPRNRLEFSGVRGQISYDFNDHIRLDAISAYRETEYATYADLDSTSAQVVPIIQTESSTQYSQELQLVGEHDRLNWVLGAYYFNEDNEGGITAPFNNLIIGGPGYLAQGYFSGGSLETDAWALFGQMRYAVLPNLNLTIGARYSEERKSVDEMQQFDPVRPYDPANPLMPFGVQQDEAEFESFTPRVALDYSPSPDILLYASWSEGFKAGTYNLGALQAPVEPETVSAWEAGVKSTLNDGDMRLNFTTFHYDYSDLQIGKVIGTALLLENAATASIYGAEVEFEANITERLSVDASFAWLHARFDDYISADPARAFGDGVTLDPVTSAPAFNLAGNRLSQAPDYTVFVGAQYEQPTQIGDITLRLEANWRDEVFFTPFNLDYVSQDAVARYNVIFSWQEASARWRVSAFVKNLTDETVIGNALVASALVGFPVNGYLEEPRTYGLTLGYRF